MLYKTSLDQSHDRIGPFSTMLLSKQQFENLEIWSESISLTKDFCSIAEKLKGLHLNILSDYVQNICTHISNNIAEISNSGSKNNNSRFLTKAHLLTLEAENILMILSRQDLIDSETIDRLQKKLDSLDKNLKQFLIALSGSNQFSA